MAAKSKLYTDIVKISEEFLGPAGERFIRRQVETHFAIQPEEIQPKHLPELVEWSRLMLAVITSDTNIVDSFTSRLLKLAGSKPTKSSVSNLRR
jgi:hypothetical protein